MPIHHFCFSDKVRTWPTASRCRKACLSSSPRWPHPAVLHLLHFQSAPSDPLLSEDLSAALPCLWALPVLAWFLLSPLTHCGLSPVTHLSWHLPARVQLCHCSALTQAVQPVLFPASPRSTFVCTHCSFSLQPAADLQLFICLLTFAAEKKKLSRSERRVELRKAVAAHYTSHTWGKRW